MKKVKLTGDQVESYLDGWDSVVLQVQLSFIILPLPDVIIIREVSAADAEMLQGGWRRVDIHPQHRQPQHPEVEVRQRNAVEPVRRPGVGSVSAARESAGANHIRWRRTGPSLDPVEPRT